MSTSPFLTLDHLKKVWTGLVVLTLAISIALGLAKTAKYYVNQLQGMLAHPHVSDIDKILNTYASSILPQKASMLAIMEQAPEHAVIGVSRVGRLGILHWSLLYPRRVVVIESQEEFERERPTHLIIDGDFPSFPVPNDPRPQWKQQMIPKADMFGVIQVRSANKDPRDSLPQGGFRVIVALVEVLAPLAVGAMLVLAIIRRWARGWPALLAIIFLVGLGTQTLLLFCLSLVGVLLTPANVLGIDALLILIGLGFAYHRRGAIQRVSEDPRPPGLTMKHVSLLALMVGLLLVHLLVTLYWPIYHVDSVGSYDYRAKAIVQQGTVHLWQFSKGVGDGWPSFSYPFFATMLNTHHYLLGGSHAKVYGTLMLSAFLALFYSVLRHRGISAFQSLFFTAVLGGNYEVMTLSQQAEVNFPQMVYGTLGFFLLLDFLSRQEPWALWLSSLGFGLAGWARTDSLVLLVVAGVVVLIAGRLSLRTRLRGLAVLVGCYVLITLPYEYFFRAVIHYDVVAHYQLSVMSLVDPYKLWQVLSYFVWYSMRGEFGYLGLPWLVVVLADWPWRQEVRPLLLTTGLMIMAWMGLFSMINTPDWEELMRLSAARWYVNLTPLYVASIAQTNFMRQVFDVLEGRLPLRVRLAL